MDGPRTGTEEQTLPQTVEAVILLLALSRRNLSFFTVRQLPRGCISAMLVSFWVNAVLFSFKVSLAVLELCSISLKIIRFYSERFIA